MINRPNRYAEACYFCQETVEPMQGILRNKTTKTPSPKNFLTVCKSCFQKNRAVLHPKHGLVKPPESEWDASKSPRPLNQYLHSRANS